MSSASSAAAAAQEAAAEALKAFSETPKLAIVFASGSYPDVDVAARAVLEVLGTNIPIVGGTAGGLVLGPDGVASRGVSVVLLGGEDIEVDARTVALASPDMMNVVPVAQDVARVADEASSRGLGHFACLVFAPGIFVDGEALVAAVRKGAGARAQLAGALTGDELTMDRPKVWATNGSARPELRSDYAVITGVFTKKHVGIAARHGWSAVGPKRKITRAEGPRLIELDGRPALAVWLEDVRKAGGSIASNASPKDVVLYLANHYELGLIPTRGEVGELIARAPWSISDDGSVTLSGSIPEGGTVRVVHAQRNDLLRASTDAASDAVLRAGSAVAGALVLACSGRLAVLGDSFPEEPERIRRRVAAPIGGACVFGEIARNERDVEAFFNTTAVVVAFSV